MLCDDLERWEREGWEGGDMGIYVYIIADSLCCKAETNTTL